MNLVVKGLGVLFFTSSAGSMIAAARCIARAAISEMRRYLCSSRSSVSGWNDETAEIKRVGLLSVHF